MKYAIKTKTKLSKVFILTIFNTIFLIATGTISTFFTTQPQPTLTIETLFDALPDAKTAKWQSTSNHVALCSTQDTIQKATQDLELLNTWKNSDNKEIRITAQKVSSGSDSLYLAQIKNYGHCPRADQYLVQSYQISGIGKAGAAISLAVEKPENIFNLLTVHSQNEVVTISSKDYSIEELALVAARIVDSQCPDKTCHSEPKIEKIAPFESNPPGWLNDRDIPLNNNSESYWYAATVDSSFESSLSSCELLNLGTVDGPKTRNHRTLIFMDSKEDKKFGIDQFILFFATNEEAEAFYKKLDGNLKKCKNHFKNTKITATEITPDSSAYEAEIITDEYKILARMGLLKTGNKVSYLYNNSYESLQFTNEEWIGIINRAAARLPRA